MNFIKNLFTSKNLIVLLMLGLGAHNYYLQTQIESIASDMRPERQRTRGDITFAEETNNLIYEALEAAEIAADYAELAYNEASQANENSFANQCSRCPY